MKRFSVQYPVWLCDIWGVIHDGHRAIASAVNALEQHRQRGGIVVLISNAPRPMDSIIGQLDGIGVSRGAYNAVVTSGDVTRSLMVSHGTKGIFRIGPEGDQSLYEGLHLKEVPLAEAGVVVCTGLFDAERETAADYAKLLDEMKQKGTAMICANPDKVVRIGGRLYPCAGALAEAYEKIGGKVVMGGKPFAPIYERALELAGSPAKSKVLAIGDGPETDIAGALANGLACVFVSGGINSGADAEAKVRAKYPKAQIVHSLQELEW